MKNFTESPGVRMTSIITVLLTIINISFAGELYPQGSEEKRNKNQSKWSVSFYGAIVFGGPGDQMDNHMRSYGIENSYMNLSSNNKYSFLTRIRPQAWMLQIDCRITNPIGLGFSYSHAVLRETDRHTGTLSVFESKMGLASSVKTVSLPLLIYLNDYMILGVGPTFNMTDSPSHSNQLGFLAHLNIRIPLSQTFSIAGICQYRYIAGTTIGSYTNENTDDIFSATSTINSIILPPTEINYSHFFIGLGMSIYFVQK